MAAGSVVKRNVPENSVVVGNPAKSLTRLNIKNEKIEISDIRLEMLQR